MREVMRPDTCSTSVLDYRVVGETVFEALKWLGPEPEKCDRQQCYHFLTNIQNEVVPREQEEIEMIFDLFQNDSELRPFLDRLKLGLKRAYGREPKCLVSVCWIMTALSCGGLRVVREFFDRDVVADLLRVIEDPMAPIRGDGEGGHVKMEPSDSASIVVHACKAVHNLECFEERVLAEDQVNEVMRIACTMIEPDYDSVVQGILLRLVMVFLSTQGKVISSEWRTAVIRKAKRVVELNKAASMKRLGIKLLDLCMKSPEFEATMSADELAQTLEHAVEVPSYQILGKLFHLLGAMSSDNQVPVAYHFLDRYLEMIVQFLMTDRSVQPATWMKFIDMCSDLLHTNCDHCDFRLLFGRSVNGAPPLFVRLHQIVTHEDFSFNVSRQAMVLFVRTNFSLEQLPIDICKYLILNGFPDNLSQYFDPLGRTHRRDVITTVCQMIKFITDGPADFRAVAIPIIAQTTLIEQVQKSPEELADGYDDEVCVETLELWANLLQ